MGSRRRCNIGFLYDGLAQCWNFNTDTGFKAGYLNELEKMLEKALPNAILKARPNIESRIWILKRDWSIVYDMLNGQNNSGFGWDEHRQLVVAEDAVWNSYLNSHKKSVNSDIVVSLTTTNLLPSMQEIERLGKMHKQPLMLLKK
ncbi:uncharacterized protein [Gossypium hirsutum]|uniref:Myb/SANT-like domain-containing protein n=1 Tax=Gossypium hirsutum TaxID=3635 RepID=A0ABM3AZ11_GOSHI|nr:uncharacterized protein LOC107904096 [Gossypium hirsutum]